MTIKQYQKLAATIANIIIKNNEDVNKVKHLKSSFAYEMHVRNPKLNKDKPINFVSRNSNDIIRFDTISNPNNPNCRYRTLKPGSISFYDSSANVNIDLSNYNFDSAQFSDLIYLIENVQWTF